MMMQRIKHSALCLQLSLFHIISSLIKKYKNYMIKSYKADASKHMEEEFTERFKLKELLSDASKH